MPKDGQYEHQIFTRISNTQLNSLEQVRVKKKYQYQSEVVRDAIEQYIQNEGNVIGSRRHFNQTMSKLLHELKEIILITFTWQLVLIAQGFTSLLRAISKEDLKLKPMDLIVESSKVAVEQYPTIRTTVEQIREARKQDEGS